MKKILTFFATLFFVCLLSAQNTQPGCYPFPKTITVNGSAEMLVVPDEIYVQVDLREYKKKGEEKTELEKIKADFLSICRSVGIADSNISVASFDGYNMSNIWRKRRKDPDLFSAISYQLKFGNLKLIDALVDKLDDQAIYNFNIVRTAHSKMTEYRKQLKIMAVKASKEKAIYLTEAVNEQLGQAITITEPEENNYDAALNNSVASNVGYNFKLKGEANDKYGDVGINYMKIKIRYEVKVLYSLK